LDPDVRAVANDRVRILRGTTTNGYGDEVDADLVVLGEFPARIVEGSRRVYIPAEGATRIIRTYNAKIGPEVDIRKGDRLESTRLRRRETKPRKYLVTEIADPLSAVMQPDISLVLSRTT
jgi:hypothetical protein